MTENNSEIVGYVGAFLLTISLIPQIVHTLKTKKVNDISYIFISIQILTCLLFLIYGVLINENPIIISNSVVLFQLIIFLFLKIKFNE